MTVSTSWVTYCKQDEQFHYTQEYLIDPVVVWGGGGEVCVRVCGEGGVRIKIYRAAYNSPIIATCIVQVHLRAVCKFKYIIIYIPPLAY